MTNKIGKSRLHYIQSGNLKMQIFDGVQNVFSFLFSYFQNKAGKVVLDFFFIKSLYQNSGLQFF